MNPISNALVNIYIIGTVFAIALALVAFYSSKETKKGR